MLFKYCKMGLLGPARKYEHSYVRYISSSSKNDALDIVLLVKGSNCKIKKF